MKEMRPITSAMEEYPAPNPIFTGHDGVAVGAQIGLSMGRYMFFSFISSFLQLGNKPSGH